MLNWLNTCSFNIQCICSFSLACKKVGSSASSSESIGYFLHHGSTGDWAIQKSTVQNKVRRFDQVPNGPKTMPLPSQTAATVTKPSPNQPSFNLRSNVDWIESNRVRVNGGPKGHALRKHKECTSLHFIPCQKHCTSLSKLATECTVRPCTQTSLACGIQAGSVHQTVRVVLYRLKHVEPDGTYGTSLTIRESIYFSRHHIFTALVTTLCQLKRTIQVKKLMTFVVNSITIMDTECTAH